MHSKLFKAETTQLFSGNNFFNYNDTSNVVVKSTEDGKTRFYCRKPDGTIYDKKVELASKPKYKWCSDNYGSKNVEVCQAKAIGIGRLSSAKRGDGRGSYCWADIEVSYDELEDTYTITYIPHPTIVSGSFKQNISGVLCFQFRDFGQPVDSSSKFKNGKYLCSKKRRYGNPNLAPYQGNRSQGRLYHSNFRFLDHYSYGEDINGNSVYSGAKIAIPNMRYRYEAIIRGRDMRSMLVGAVCVGRNIREFNKAQIEKIDSCDKYINAPLIGLLNTGQFMIGSGYSPKYDIRSWNNDISKRGTRNSVRNNKHRLEVKCRYVLCTYPSGITESAFQSKKFLNSVKRCNSQVFTGVVQLDGAGIVRES